MGSLIFASTTFEYRGQEVRTTITSVDVSEGSDTEMVKVFLGFARK